ncbi:MAG: gluconate 2-dehydrogenase subunit 3 family protein, partial [Acetobacteraceae bacterium]|nr:gluconate 2-dehydrogenase subunit 3 family protein [Acetobacteraceae bacterium]
MTERPTTGRYPGYDVTSKRTTQSWNDKTREVIDARLAVEARPAFLSSDEWQTLVALCDRVMPQPEGRPRVALAAFVDRQLLAGKTKGYRFADMSQPAEAWKRALAALDEVAGKEQGRPFAHLTQDDQDTILRRMSDGSFQAVA